MKTNEFVRYLCSCALLLIAFLLVGCGPATPEPTATPTKTPTAGEEQAAAPATPTPAPATETPAPQPDPPTPTPMPANIAPFTGLPVEDVASLSQRPIFICINNDAVGRSAHYGLDAADLVYEYIVDGFTVTRITALYQSQAPARVGPVRSARMPNIWMTYMYDGVLACSGGSDEIRYLLKNEVGFPYLDADIDDPSNTVYFSNLGTDYRTRLQASPAGVRRWLADVAQRCTTNPQQIYCQEVFNNLMTDRGTLKPWNREGFQFSETPPDFSTGTASTIQIPYPGGNSVEWRYDPQQNRYVRYQGGQPHVDQATGQPITAENVVVMYAEHELTNIVEDSLGTRGVDIKLYGFGDFRIFRDGRVYEGTWRANDQSPPRWLGAGEQIVPLKPGRTWIQVVRNSDKITYQ